MRRFRSACASLAILASGLALAVGSDQKLSPAETEVPRLVRQIGSDEFDKREEATARLKEIGESALGALHKAMMSQDAEVRRRAEDIVAAVENKLYGPELLLTGHMGALWKVSVSADGKRMASASHDGTARIWRAPR